MNLGAEDACVIGGTLGTWYGLSDLPCFSTWSVCVRSARRRRVSLSWWHVPMCPDARPRISTMLDGHGPTPADSTLSPILGRVSSIEYMFILISHDKAGRTHDPASGKEPWHRRVARPCRDRLARREDEIEKTRPATRHHTRRPRVHTRQRWHSVSRGRGGHQTRRGTTRKDGERQGRS